VARAVHLFATEATGLGDIQLRPGSLRSTTVESSPGTKLRGAASDAQERALRASAQFQLPRTPAAYTTQEGGRRCVSVPHLDSDDQLPRVFPKGRRRRHREGLLARHCAVGQNFEVVHSCFVGLLLRGSSLCY
jgi:hypothetical protein